MWFVVLGTLLLILKVADFGPVGQLSWWWVLSPFAVAAAWWAYADWSGLTKQREMDKMEKRKLDRRQRNMENLGLEQKKDKRRR